MQISIRGTRLVALCALLAALAACQPDAETKRNAELGAVISELPLSGALGFICRGNKTRTVCTCKPGVPSTDAMTCDGMKEACDKLGTPMTCTPDGKNCDCG